MTLLARSRDNTTVVLVRHEDEREAIIELSGGHAIIPSDAIDSRSLMHRADLVIGAGGTMTREAALLGAPTVSVFAGPQPAVDRWLERKGLLRRLEKATDVAGYQTWTRNWRDLDRLRQRSETLTGLVVDEIIALGSGRAGFS